MLPIKQWTNNNGPIVWLLIQDNSLPEHGSQCRHAYFAKYLTRMNYRPIVVAASKARCSREQMITDSSPIAIDTSHGFPFVYVRVNDYGDSMKRRLLAVAEFHLRAWRHLRRIAAEYGQPDVVLGSSAYPVTPVLARRLARRYKAKSICEIRDLWPLSLEEYGIIKTGGMVARAMYALEKHNYERSDALVFTMAGGPDYLVDKRWDVASGGKVNLEKVAYINNGVDLEEFDRCAAESRFDSPALAQEGTAKIVYTGSVRKANDLGFLVEVADRMRGSAVDFIVIGDGVERPALEQEAQRRGIANLHFLGAIDKELVPSALSQSALLLLYSRSQRGLSRYGMSQNKQFEYLAAGKPVLSNLPSRYSVINERDCGYESSFESPDEFAEQVAEMLSDGERLDEWGKHSRMTAKEFDFAVLAERLATVIDGLTPAQSGL